MKKLGNGKQWSWILNNVKTHCDFHFKNVWGVSSFSTASTAAASAGRIKKATATAKMEDNSMRELFSRISPLGNPSASIVPVLDQWVEEGKPVEKHLLQFYIKLLRSYRRYTHALQMSHWMTDKRYFPVSGRDVAMRLDLIEKVHGIEQAEKYFNSVPEHLKGLAVYSALLNCYVHAKSVEKAEAVMQKMRDLGFERSTLAFSTLLSLYLKTGNFEKLDALLREMDEKGIAHDRFTYGICLSAYATRGNVEGIDNIVQTAESDSNVALGWDFYSTAGGAYMKVGHLDKAFAALKKSEELIGGRGKGTEYDFLLTQYATLGKKEEVLRLWEVYKRKVRKVYNKGYMYMIISLLKLDDIESAEKIFYEWESQTPHTLNYNIDIPNFLLGAYSRKGSLEKIESFVNRIRVKEGKPNARTWCYIATAMLRHNAIEKAVEAIKEATLIYDPRWKIVDESLVTGIEYLKGEGDSDRAKEFINLLGEKGIISSEVQGKMLQYVEDESGDTPKLAGLLRLDTGALHGS